MTNAANNMRPVNFDEYVGQAGAANYIKSVIASGAHPSGVIISGVPGTGKTTLAQLYTRATLCENREEGLYEACGQCDSCKNNIEDHPNVTYYRITEASTFKDVVGDLIALTKAAPAITHDNLRTDNNRRFIIIDELQNATRQSISPFLDSLEFAVPNVTVILISMDMDKLDNVVRDAIESRCIELSLERHTEEAIKQKLLEGLEYEILEESAELIAYLAKGNLRRAWSKFEKLHTELGSSGLTPEAISKSEMSGLNEDKCNELISLLEDGTWKDSSKLIKSVASNPVLVVDYFVNHLIKQDLDEDGVEMVSSLSYWLQSSYKVPILAAFRSYQGKRILKRDTIEEPVYHQVDSIESTQEDLNAMKDSITSQLQAITGTNVKEEVKHPYLKFTKWSEFIEYYADNK